MRECLVYYFSIFWLDTDWSSGQACTWGAFCFPKVSLLKFCGLVVFDRRINQNYDIVSVKNPKCHVLFPLCWFLFREIDGCLVDDCQIILSFNLFKILHSFIFSLYIQRICLIHCYSMFFFVVLEFNYLSIHTVHFIW